MSGVYFFKFLSMDFVKEYFQQKKKVSSLHNMPRNTDSLNITSNIWWFMPMLIYLIEYMHSTILYDEMFACLGIWINLLEYKCFGYREIVDTDL